MNQNENYDENIEYEYIIAQLALANTKIKDLDRKIDSAINPQVEYDL